MLKNIEYVNLRHSRLYKALYLLSLGVFILSFFSDACVDSFCPPDFYYYDLNEDDPATVQASPGDPAAGRKFVDARKAVKHESPHYLALLKTPPRQITPALLLTPVQDSADDIKSSHAFPPVSSDSSPPCSLVSDQR